MPIRSDLDLLVLVRDGLTEACRKTMMLCDGVCAPTRTEAQTSLSNSAGRNTSRRVT